MAFVLQRSARQHARAACSTGGRTAVSGCRPRPFASSAQPQQRASLQLLRASSRQDPERTEEDNVRLRSEAEAPFRSLRFTLFGFGIASSVVASLISLPQLAGALAGAPSALPVQDVVTNLGINIAVLGVCGVLLRNDLQARDKQMARLTREEKLGKLLVRLSSGKAMPLSALRGSARVVIAAGTRAQVKSALEAAAPMREELQRRGVFVVPLPIYASANDAEDAAVEIPAPGPEDLRWCATPLRTEEWAGWFESQLKFATKATADKGLFVGLRLDGRVRSSGQGLPPWQRYMMELAPLSGDDKWSGFFDGFDGRVGSMD